MTQTFKNGVAVFLRARGWEQVQLDRSGRLYWRHKSASLTRAREIEVVLFDELSAAAHDGDLDPTLMQLKSCVEGE